jgi:hypothetical protein
MIYTQHSLHQLIGILIGGSLHLSPDTKRHQLVTEGTAILKLLFEGAPKLHLGTNYMVTFPFPSNGLSALNFLL